LKKVLIRMVPRPVLLNVTSDFWVSTDRLLFNLGLIFFVK